MRSRLKTNENVSYVTMSKSQRLNSDFNKIGNFQRLLLWSDLTKF